MANRSSTVKDKRFFPPLLSTAEARQPRRDVEVVPVRSAAKEPENGQRRDGSSARVR